MAIDNSYIKRKKDRILDLSLILPFLSSFYLHLDNNVKCNLKLLLYDYLLWIISMYIRSISFHLPLLFLVLEKTAWKGKWVSSGFLHSALGEILKRNKMPFICWSLKSIEQLCRAVLVSVEIHLQSLAQWRQTEGKKWTVVLKQEFCSISNCTVEI